MNPGALPLAAAALMFVAITAYALFAGADFGGGIWDMLAGNTRHGQRPRTLIDRSVTPVWEANHVWLVLMLVVLWSAFPAAFAAVMTVLFVPLNLSLLGIFCRGVGFAFRHSAERLRMRQLYGVLFAASSVMTPFFLGTVAGAIATGAVRAGLRGDRLSAWTSPTALLTGALAVAACAHVAAVYLVDDARRWGDPALVRYFRRRALASGAVAGALAVATLAAMRSDGPYVFHGLFHRALPLLLLSLLAGAGTLALVAGGLVRAPRPLAALTVAAAVWGWAVAQYPWLLPGSLSLGAGAAPTGTLVTELVTAGMVAAFVVPGFVLLYRLQQRGLLTGGDDTDALRAAVAARERARPAGGGAGAGGGGAGAGLGGGRGGPGGGAGSPGERLLGGILVVAAAAGILRRALGRTRHGDRGPHRGAR